jgi:hypothetical protein
MSTRALWVRASIVVLDFIKFTTQEAEKVKTDRYSEFAIRPIRELNVYANY